MQHTTFSFTEKKVQNLASESKTKTYSDTKVPNLKLTVTSKGTKTYYVRFKVQNKSKMIKLGSAKHLQLDDARLRAIEYLNSVHKEKWQIEPNLTSEVNNSDNRFSVNDAFNAYYDNHLKYKRRHGKSRHTLETAYVKHLASDLAKMKVAQLNRKWLAKYFKNLLNEKGATIHNKCVSVIKAMFNYCLDYEEDFPLEHNPAQSLKKEEEISRDRFLTLEEARQLLATMDTHEHHSYTDIFKLALFTGARISNVRAMRWEEINFELASWIVPAIKTKSLKTYHLPLCDQALTILTKRKLELSKTSDFVFPSKSSKSGYMMGGDTLWKEIITAAGLYSVDKNRRLRKHDLRRTFATWQALKGTDINIISKTLGHSDIKVTQIYARINLEKASESVQRAFEDL